MNPVNNNNYMNFNQSANFQPYQMTQYFPQPQGSIYMIGNSSEVANVPVGVGLSAAICLREGLIYLKTIQNGSPMLLSYKLSPLENNTLIQEKIIQNPNSTDAPVSAPETSIEQRILNVLEEFDARLKKLETPEKPKGGSEKWQL